MSVKESDHQDDYALDLLHELLDNISYRIILSIIESARSVGGYKFAKQDPTKFYLQED